MADVTLTPAGKKKSLAERLYPNVPDYSQNPTTGDAKTLKTLDRADSILRAPDLANETAKQVGKTARLLQRKNSKDVTPDDMWAHEYLRRKTGV